MKFLIGKKLDMTQQFAPDGTVVPVTRISVAPCFVTEKKTIERDGYVAVQVASCEGVARKANHPLAGFLKKVFGSAKFFYELKEFRLEAKDSVAEKLQIGQTFGASIFNIGDTVTVQGYTKGKGFQGVVKRHGFHGGPASHGDKDQMRMPGSIGATHPNHVFAGMRMAGHDGNELRTVQGLEVISITPAGDEIWVKGAIPGARNSVVYLRADGEFVAEDTGKKEEVVAEVVAEPVVEPEVATPAVEPDAVVEVVEPTQDSPVVEQSTESKQ